jgi:uncharacterized protein
MSVRPPIRGRTATLNLRGGTGERSRLGSVLCRFIPLYSVDAAYPGCMAEKSNTRNQAPAEFDSQAVPGDRAELLRGLAERTFPDLPYAKLREPRDQERETGARRRLHEYRAEILEIAGRYGASNVRLFGSVARGEDTAASDIDLLVDMAAGSTLLSLAGLAEELTSLIGVKVDVATPDILRDEIRADALASLTAL